MGKELWIKLKPEKYVFLDKSQSMKSQCEQNVSFYESFDMLLLDKISQKCPRKCLPYTSKNLSNPICKTEDEENCASNMLNEVLPDGSFINQCKKPCVITQYLETYEWNGNYYSPDDYKFAFYYILSKNETIVYEEYLIHDLISMIGSVGGTLGMFIGFSFINVVNVIIFQIRKCLFHVIIKFK